MLNTCMTRDLKRAARLALVPHSILAHHTMVDLTWSMTAAVTVPSILGERTACGFYNPSMQDACYFLFCSLALYYISLFDSGLSFQPNRYASRQWL